MKNEKLSAIRNYVSQNMDIIYALIAITVTMFLLVGRFLLMDGAVLFGDFVPTLEIQQFLRVHFPSWSNRNNFNSVGLMRLPYLIIFFLPFYIVDAPAEVFFKFMIMSTLLISGFSMYITAKHFLKKLEVDKKLLFLTCLVSSIFYAFNPWVMDRVYHIFLLITYSLLPLIFLVSVKTFNTDRINLKLILALVIISTVASTSPHSLFFIIFLITSLYAYFSLLKPKQFIPKTKNFVLFILLYTLVSSFWLLPLLSYIFSGGSLFPDYVVQMNDLETLSRNSNLFKVLTLEAYWWQKVSHSFTIFPMNVLWVFTSLVIPVLCFSSLIFHKKSKIVVYLSILSLLLIFLAAGTRSPAPNFYEWLTFDAPILSSFGWLFRDPNKWTLLLPTAYSTLSAFAYIGIVKVIRSFKRAYLRKAALTFFTLLIFSSLFIYITPSATNYFSGPFKPLKIPPEIYEVNSWLENDSAYYNVLWLPSYSRWGASWVYDGLAGAFELDSSAKPTFDFDSKYSKTYLNYFEMALTDNRSVNAADYLYPLNVRYIIFHNDSASNPDSLDYTKNLFQSLNSQKDLEIVKHDGNIYVFENKKWRESVFQSKDKALEIVGGFDRLTSLNALNIFNFSDFSIIFLDQNFPCADENFDALILSGDLLNDALPLFINESLTLAPFDFSRRYDPANFWSKASLSDLLGGSFHPALKPFGVECWDFDYDKGVVFTWASSAKLDMPFFLSSNGNFSFFARVFKNFAGGKVNFYVDGSLVGTVDTQSQINRFLWMNVNVLNLASGSHVLTFENAYGLNAVNLVTFMPLEKALELKDRLATAVQGKDLLYVLEAETDMVRENAFVENYSWASDGKVVFLTRNSTISQSIELIHSGNYTFAIRGMGDLLLKIDNKSCKVSLEQFDSKNFTANLNSGLHKIEVSSFSVNETGIVDALWLWKQSENSSQSNTSAKILSVSEVDPTRFIVELEVNESFMLCFFKAYDPAWSASFNGKVVRATRVFGVANGFWIDVKGKVVITVEFQPQKWFYVGLTVSLLTLLVCFACLLYTWWKGRLYGF